VLKWKFDSDQGKVVEKCIGFLMSDEIVQGWIYDAPQRSLLNCTLFVLAMQEGNVEHFLRLISSMIKQFLVLEEGMLDITMLFELRNINFCLGYGSLPAVIGQINRVAKAFNTSFKSVVFNILDIQTEFHI